MNRSLSALALSVTIALTPTTVDAKKSSVAGAVAGTLSKKPVPRSIPKIIQKKPSLLSRAGDIMKSGVSTDDFYKRLMLTRAAVGGAQFLALTPTTVDAIASAQYGAMMGQERILAESHPTVRRVREITSRLTQAVESDPDIPREIKARMHWEVKVIEKNVVNAFCMPGGKMAIYTGIINNLKLTDSEIAVIMGHEITHALRDHGYKRMRDQIGSNVLIALAGAKTGSMAAVTAADVGNSLWQLSHSRDHEREADQIGLNLVHHAGYDVCAGEKVWEKMGSLSKSTPPAILSTHPPSQERQKNLRKQAEHLHATCKN